MISFSNKNFLKELYFFMFLETSQSFLCYFCCFLMMLLKTLCHFLCRAISTAFERKAYVFATRHQFCWTAFLTLVYLFQKSFTFSSYFTCSRCNHCNSNYDKN